MDNEQFKFGQTLRPTPGYVGLIFDGLKRMYITKIKGFNVDTMCVATLVFEGKLRFVFFFLMYKNVLVLNLHQETLNNKLV